MLKPPSIQELIRIPEFRAMMKKRPFLPPHMQHGTPFRLWALTVDDRWLTKQYATYDEAWAVAVPRIKDTDKYADVCITVKPLLTPRTITIEHAMKPLYLGWEWCGRCRRPTMFRAFPPSHHALRLQPLLTDDDPFRCYYCGIRRAMGEY